MARSATAPRGTFRPRTATVVYISAIATGAAGMILIVRSALKAADGSPEAIGLLASFFAAVAGLFWLIRKTWPLILDQSDILDVFRKTAKEKKSKVEPVLIRTDRPDRSFKEHGYRFRLNEYASETDISLIQIEMETPDHFVSQTGSYYLVFRIPADIEPAIAFISPKLPESGSADILLYMDAPGGTGTDGSHSVARTLTSYPPEWTAGLFANPFIANELNVLFSIYRMKYIVLRNGSLTAVKDGAVDSCAYDIEAYHLLHRLIQLIQDYHKRYIHQTP